MNIEISTEEYRDLLDVLHIADAVIHGHRREEDAGTARHRALIQKLYALAGSAGFDRLVRRNESTGRYVPTVDFEQGTLAHAVIDKFGEHLFWDQLIGRLTFRDAAEMAGGVEFFNALNDTDRQRLEDSIRQKYIQEFTTNGVANLTVIERLGTGGGAPVKTSD